MALIVEDGTGLANAESYASVAEATTYHTNSGSLTAWAAVANQEAALRKATRYMLGRYLDKWVGEAAYAEQRLDWPRAGAVTRNLAVLASDMVPEDVKSACAELALRSASGALLPDSTQAVKREKVGPLEVEYNEYSSASNPYREVDALLAPYLLPGALSGISVALRRT